MVWSRGFNTVSSDTAAGLTWRLSARSSVIVGYTFNFVTTPSVTYRWQTQTTRPINTRKPGI